MNQQENLNLKVTTSQNKSNSNQTKSMVDQTEQESTVFVKHKNEPATEEYPDAVKTYGERSHPMSSRGN